MNKAIGLILMSGLAAVPGVASADSTLNITLRAHADVFCHIYPPADNSVDVHDGAATIGQVREICNTPSGYDVATRFTNVTSGELNVGGRDYALVDGAAIRSSDVPAVQTLAWSLHDTQLTEATQPVVMQVTITPR